MSEQVDTVRILIISGANDRDEGHGTTSMAKQPDFRRIDRFLDLARDLCRGEDEAASRSKLSATAWREPMDEANDRAIHKYDLGTTA